MKVHGAGWDPGHRVDPDIGHGLPIHRTAAPRLQGNRNPWQQVSDSANGSSGELEARDADPTLGRRLRIEPQVSKDLLDHRSLQDGGDDLELALKPLAVCKGSWPRSDARPIDFIATLPSVNLHLQRQLWSR